MHLSTGDNWYHAGAGTACCLLRFHLFSFSCLALQHAGDNWYQAGAGTSFFQASRLTGVSYQRLAWAAVVYNYFHISYLVFYCMLLLEPTFTIFLRTDTSQFTACRGVCDSLCHFIFI